MSKNRLSFRKNCKKRRSVGGCAPNNLKILQLIGWTQKYFASQAQEQP